MQPPLPPGTRVLEAPGASRLYLLGTSHASPASAAAAAALLARLRPRCLLLETCPSRLPSLLQPPAAARWRFARVSLAGRPSGPGSPSAASLLAPFPPAQRLSRARLDAGAARLMGAGLFSRLTCDALSPRFAGAALHPSCPLGHAVEAEAAELALHVTPRSLPRYSSVCVSADAAVSGADGARLAWLPRFHRRFAALRRAAGARRRALSGLRLCLLARAALSQAGREAGAEPLRLRFERDRLRPRTMLLALSPLGAGEGSWEEGAAAALGGPAAACALPLPPPPPPARARAARGARAALARAAGEALLSAAAALAAAQAWLAGAAYGDDMRAALSAAAAARVPLLLLADRPLRATTARLGRAALRWALGWAAAAAAAMAVVTAEPWAAAAAAAAAAARGWVGGRGGAAAAVVAERDRLMAAACLAAARGAPQAHAANLRLQEEGGGEGLVSYRLGRGGAGQGGPVVALVGAVHVEGVTRAWLAHGGRVVEEAAGELV